MVIPTSPDSFDKWATVYETEDGGAIVCMDFENNLGMMVDANEKLKELGIEAVLDINSKETAFILVDQNNVVVPFDVVMKTLFG